MARSSIEDTPLSREKRQLIPAPGYKLMKYYPVQKLDEFAKRIISLMPPLEQFFLSDNSILENSKKLYSYNSTEIYKQRQKPFIALIQKKVEDLFSKEELEQIKMPSMNDGLKGGVVDHHGILNHPSLIGVNVVPQFFRMFDRDTNGDILTFATGNIPLNDPFHRRGFMINDCKVNLFPKSDKNKIVYGLKKYDFQIVKSLQLTHQWKFHSLETQKFLQNIQKIIDAIDFSNCNTLGDQITKINFHLWPMLFEPGLREKVSNLISIEYDDIVIEYLLYVLENDKGSFIYRLLFDKNFQTKMAAHFEGKTGAWDEESNRGTQFFWGVDENNEHLRMILNNGKLQSSEGNLVIDWNLESLTDALRNKKILPGMLLKFSLILFYMGIKPFAGYGSGNYLTIMQKDMTEFLKDEYPQEVENINSITVNNITSVPVLLKRGKNHEIESYFAFDIMFNGGLSQTYFDKINSVPLKFFMAPNLNAMYEYAFNLYGNGQKENITATPSDYEPLLNAVV